MLQIERDLHFIIAFIIAFDVALILDVAVTLDLALTVDRDAVDLGFVFDLVVDLGPIRDARR